MRVANLLGAGSRLLPMDGMKVALRLASFPECEGFFIVEILLSEPGKIATTACDKQRAQQSTETTTVRRNFAI